MPVLGDFADADDTDERALIHGREMADSSSEHLLHELVDRRVGRSEPNLARHEDRDGIRKNLGTPAGNPAYDVALQFLTLPWIHTPNLAAHVLAIIRGKLPED